jgi:hypothetical protein
VGTMLAVTYVTFYAVISLRPADDRRREVD